MSLSELLRRSLLPVLVFLAVFGVVVTDARGLVLRDGDTYWHLAVGQWILANHALPRLDFLSYTAAGAPWVPHEYLAEIIMAAADRLAGWSGVVALTGLAAAATLGLLAHHLGRFLGPLAATALVALAGLSVILVLLARPHILALPLVEIWAAGLVIARAEGRAPRLRLVPLMTLWANLHGGFMVGVALAWLLGAEAVLEAGAAWRDAARRWGIFAAAATLAAMVTPTFPEGFLLPFRFLGMSSMFAIVTEWRSPNFQNLDPLEVMVLAALLFGFGRGFRMPWFRAVLLAGLVWAAFQHIRNEVLVGIVGTLLIAEPLGRHLRARPFRGPGQSGRATLPFELAIWTPTFLGFLALLWLNPVERGPDSVTPEAAFDHLSEALRAQPVFNQYDFGGYLIHRGVKPFIDGRTEIFPPAFLERYSQAANGDSAALQDILGRYKIAWTLFPPHSAVVAVLDASPDWQRVYADDVAVLQVRKVAPPTEPTAP
ncbi:MAG TPA: hypothetical protein VKS60_08645 [Stellaceae bacterium]|nr:hypothetical protein [Stellaceae bacterium]